jgi:hypothetical protein
MAGLANVAQPDLARARPWGLLIDNAAKLNSDRWLGGVGFNSSCTPAGERVAVEFCDYNQGYFPDEPVGEFVEFSAFVVLFDQTCSTLGSTYGWLRDNTMNRAAVEASSQFADQLINPVGGNPSLEDGTDLGTTGDQFLAMAAIEGWLAQTLKGAQGVIHVPPSAFSQLGGDLIFDGTSYMTTTGHVVVPDAGYEQGSSPYNVGRIYGSGNVAVGYDTPRPLGNESESIDFRRNIETARAVMEGIVVFDPCTVAYADYSLSAGGGGGPIPRLSVTASVSDQTADATITDSDGTKSTTIDWGD